MQTESFYKKYIRLIKRILKLVYSTINTKFGLNQETFAYFFTFVVINKNPEEVRSHTLLRIFAIKYRQDQK